MKSQPAEKVDSYDNADDLMEEAYVIADSYNDDDDVMKEDDAESPEPKRTSKRKAANVGNLELINNNNNEL